jgi:hypothetical protein
MFTPYIGILSVSKVRGKQRELKVCKLDIVLGRKTVRLYMKHFSRCTDAQLKKGEFYQRSRF